MWFPLCLLIVSIKGVCQCPWLFYFFFLNCHSSGYVQRNVLDLLELELQVLMSCLMYVLGIKLRSHLFSPFMFVLIQSYVCHTLSSNLLCIQYFMSVCHHTRFIKCWNQSHARQSIQIEIPPQSFISVFIGFVCFIIGVLLCFRSRVILYRQYFRLSL